MPAASAIKVMVVDDQTSMRAMIRRTLQDLGFKDVRDKPGAVEAPVRPGGTSCVAPLR